MTTAGIEGANVTILPGHDSELKLSPDEYAAASGARCPNCLSHDLDGGGFDLNGGDVSQDISCNTCGARWVDCYALQGYGLYEGPDE